MSSIPRSMNDIIRKWIDFFIYNIEFPPEKINKKI
jgi:hypothetical protein